MTTRGPGKDHPACRTVAWAGALGAIDAFHVEAVSNPPRPAGSRLPTIRRKLRHTSRMVAIIRCDRDEAERRDSGRQIAARLGLDSTLNITRRRKAWKSGSHLT